MSDYDYPAESIALALYNSSNSLNEAQVSMLARTRSVEEWHEMISQVEYVTYIFADGSKLTVGNNGYVGVEGVA